MTNGSAVKTAPVPAPSGYEELYARDGGYIRKLVRRELGPAVSQEDVEDTAQHISEKLFLRNVLGMYDPDDSSGASWHTFLGRQVILYCRWRRQDLAKRAAREPAQLDAPAGDGQARWIDLYGAGQWDDYPFLGDEELVSRIRAYLETVPDSWQPSGQLRLGDLFDTLVVRVQDGGKVSASSLGISPLAARRGMAALRRALQPVLRPVTLPLQAGGTLRVTREDVAQAVKVLEANPKSTAVRQPLARAGNPLAAMDYRALALAEQQRYAKLRSGPGGRQEHVGHVKAAVLHHLHHLLKTKFPPPDPGPESDPEPTAEDLFESELWHLHGMTPQKLDQLKELARQLPR